MRLLLLFSGLMLSPGRGSKVPCHLCKNLNLTRPLEMVDSRGKTCAALMVNMFSLDSGTRQCRQLVMRNQVRCCTLAQVEQIPQDPPADAISLLKRGPYKRCDLCYTKDFPYNTAMVINMLYIGVGSCKQYWDYGVSGWIPTHLCSALQFFAYEPCGCGKFNPLKPPL